MDDNILKLFEGLSPDQAKAYRARIMPTLEGLRREITTNPAPKATAPAAENTLHWLAEYYQWAEQDQTKP